MSHLFSPGRVLFKCIAARLDPYQRERIHKVVKGIARPHLWEYDAYDEQEDEFIRNFKVDMDTGELPFEGAPDYYNSLKEVRRFLPDKIDEWHWIRGKRVRRCLKKAVDANTIRRLARGDFLILVDYDEEDYRGDNSKRMIRVSRKDEKAVRKILKASKRFQVRNAKNTIKAIRENGFMP